MLIHEEDYPLLRHYEKEDSIEALRIKEWLKQNATNDEAKKYYTLLKTWEPVTTSFERTDKYDNCELRDTKWLVIKKAISFQNESKSIFLIKLIFYSVTKVIQQMVFGQFILIA